MRTSFALRGWEAIHRRSRSATLVALSTLALTLTGCGVVKGIFKAGFWVGIVLAVFLVVGVLGAMRTLSRH
jgi:uncharacterized membrane protein